MMSTLESLLGLTFTVGALLYAEGKLVTWGFFFVNCCFTSICPPKKIVDQGGKAAAQSKKMPYFVFIITTAHIFSLLVVKKSSLSIICMIRVWVPPPHPQILFQMLDFYFHSWVDEVFSTYLKSEFWGLKLSSSRRAQTGVECVGGSMTSVSISLSMANRINNTTFLKWVF